MTTSVLVAGSTGMLGNRIASHVLDQSDVAVRLLLRPSEPSDDAKSPDALVSRGAVAVIGDVTNPASLDPATAGVDVVVSALQGGSEVIVDGQVALAESAVRNGVRRRPCLGVERSLSLPIGGGTTSAVIGASGAIRMASRSHSTDK